MINLNGLEVKDYIHPEEASAWKTIMKASWLKAFLSWIGKEETKLNLKLDILGNAIRIKENDIPVLYNPLKKACEILDYDQMPQIYIRRDCSFNMTIFYDDVPIVVVPDFMVNICDEEDILFRMGRAVSQLKKDNVQMEMFLKSSAELLRQIPGVGVIAVPIVANWIRKADLTADRGGLLACQDIWIAERTMMNQTGMPKKYLAKECMPHYMRNVNGISTIADVSQGLQTLLQIKSWNNDRITSLYNWYSSGHYDDLIEKFE